MSNKNKTPSEKQLKRMYCGEPCVIGIDQSYARTGISIAINGKLKKVGSIDFKGITEKSGKRKEVKRVVTKAIKKCLNHFEPYQICIVCERIRTMTNSFDIRPDYMKSTGALIATIVDTAWEYNIKTYSIDTRAWKSAVLGNSRPVFPPVEGVKDPQKFGSVAYVIKLGFDNFIKREKGRGGKSIFSRDDDAADSACIALSPFKAERNRFKQEF